MTGAFAWLIVASLGQTPPAAEGGTAARPAGPVALFNGKDLSGWTQPLENAAEWRVVDGLLEGLGGGRKQPALLVTERQDFANYRLLVTFAFADKGGGGIELRYTGDMDALNAYWVAASAGPYFEVKERPPGHITKLAGYRFGDLFPPPRPARIRAAAAANRWHTLDVTVAGNRITTVLDGRTVDDFTDRGKEPLPPGAIALLARGDSILRVKDVQIQELPE